MSDRTMGLAILRTYHHAGAVNPGTPSSAVVRPAYLAGRAMAYAERLRDQGAFLTPKRALLLGKSLGISQFELLHNVLPTLRAANVLEYQLVDANLRHIEEYVNVTGSLLEQTVRVFEAHSPEPADLAAVLSGQLAAHSPLTQRNHLDAIIAHGIGEQDAIEGVRAAATIGMLKRHRSTELGDHVLFSEHVWSTGVVEIAAFMARLPSTERSVLVGLVETAAARPGTALSRLAPGGVPGGDVLLAARRVGLIDAVQVQSRSSGPQTYAFSPLMERELAASHSTDALHERKLFVAHIMFGHEFARSSTGRIDDPLVLVDRLLRRGSVGPATAISNDYMLLETYGIVRVEPVTDDGRSMLHVVKEDVVHDGLKLLQQTLPASSGSPQASVDSLWLPGGFVPPEADRAGLAGGSAEADELMGALITRLRVEAERVTRDEVF